MKGVDVGQIEGELMKLDRLSGTDFHSNLQLARTSVRLAITKWLGINSYPPTPSIARAVGASWVKVNTAAYLSFGCDRPTRPYQAR